MKKSTLIALTDYFEATDIPESIADAVAELRAEREKGEEKAQANREMYGEAKKVVMAVISTEEPMTVAQIFEACKSDLPEGFSKSKVQYGVREYWADELIKHDNGKGPFTYTKA